MVVNAPKYEVPGIRSRRNRNCSLVPGPVTIEYSRARYVFLNIWYVQVPGSHEGYVCMVL